MAIVSANDNINLNVTGDDLILQNVANILRTFKGECGLNRKFGISSSTLDKPQMVVQAKLSKEIADQIRDYIPQVKLKEIKFETELDRLIPILEVEIIG